MVDHSHKIKLHNNTVHLQCLFIISVKYTLVYYIYYSLSQ